jgi:ribosomal protein S18 acetylase RimI-like enzyme
MASISFSSSERPTAPAWLDFLRRSDLGTLYPRRAFAERFPRMVRNVDVVTTAYDGDLLVGLGAGLTDFAYFLFLTDLGVARGYERRGIGRRLVELAIAASGGPRDVCAVTWSNREAVAFYERCGLVTVPTLVGRESEDGQPFDPRTFDVADLGGLPWRQDESNRP